MVFGWRQKVPLPDVGCGSAYYFLVAKAKGSSGGTYKLTNNIIVRNTFRSLSHCPRSYCVYFVIHRILFSTLR